MCGGREREREKLPSGVRPRPVHLRFNVLMKEEIKPSDWNRYNLYHLTDYYITLKDIILPSIHKQTLSIIYITFKCLRHQSHTTLSVSLLPFSLMKSSQWLMPHFLYTTHIFMYNTFHITLSAHYMYAFWKIKSMGIHVNAFKINHSLQLPRQCSLDSIFPFNLSADFNCPPTQTNVNTHTHRKREQPARVNQRININI